jgi:macrolide-specific efflux system membrane fusion protein
MSGLFASLKSALPVTRQGRWMFASLITIAVVIISGLWLAGDDEEIIYTSAPVTRGNIENLVTATGTLQPRDYVDVGAQVSGQLKTLHVEVGSEVKKGDLLAEIDATVYLARVDSTRAQLRNQKAQLLDRQAQLKLAQVNYTRQYNLQKEDATTRESLESAEASLQSAKAQIEALQAQIEQIESSLRAEEANLEFANIYAPMDGTVVSITSRQGQTLNTNQMAPTLLRIADLSIMTVQAQVSEADISKLRKGMKVYFTTLGSEGQRWYSELNRIEPTPTILNNVVLYNALFDVPNPNGLLMTQMTTQVFFVTAEAQDVVLVPMSAVSFSVAHRGGTNMKPAQRNNSDALSARDKSQSGSSLDAREKVVNRPMRDGIERRQAEQNNATGSRQASVRVRDAKGGVAMRDVQVGVTNRIQAEIIAGLVEGEQVVTGVQQPDKPTPDNSRAFGQPRMMR